MSEAELIVDREEVQPIAVYVRVSTTEQNEESQLVEIAKWIQSQGIDAAKTTWYIDKASGKNFRRHRFGLFLNAAREGLHTTLIIWKLDRLSRQLFEGVALIGELMELGIRVVSITQQIDMSGAMGKMVATLFLGFAELEREIARERQAVGIAAAKERDAKRVEAGKEPKHYKGGSKKKGWRKVHPQKVFESFDMGLTYSEIARKHGISVQTVRRYMKKYSGKYPDCVPSRAVRLAEALPEEERPKWWLLRADLKKREERKAALKAEQEQVSLQQQQFAE